MVGFTERKNMTATARNLKPKVIIPTLKERATALIEELLEAPVEERVEVLSALHRALDGRLDLMAEALRPKGEGSAVPAGAMRNEWNARGKRLAGECVCRSFEAAIKT